MVDLIKVIAGIVTIVVSFFLGGFLGAGQDYAPVISVLAGLSGFLIGFSRFLSPTQQIAAVIIIEALLLSILRKYETVDGTIGYTVGINVRVILPWLGSALVAYCLRRLIAN